VGGYIHFSGKLLTQFRQHTVCHHLQEGPPAGCWGLNCPVNCSSSAEYRREAVHGVQLPWSGPAYLRATRDNNLVDVTVTDQPLRVTDTRVDNAGLVVDPPARGHDQVSPFSSATASQDHIGKEPQDEHQEV